MVSEDHNTLNLTIFGLGLFGNLTNASVMVESWQAGDVLFFYVFGKMTQYVSVGVGWVCDDDTLYIWFGHM